MSNILTSIQQKHLTPFKVNHFWFIYYAVGVAGFAIPFTQDIFKELIGFSIVLSLILMLYFHKPWNGKFIAAAILITTGGFFIEALGVNTGLIFGSYTYGNTLGPGVFGTPFLIGLNWLMLIYIVSQIMRYTMLSTFAQLILGATLMTGYDAFLEPVAMATNMWNWSGQEIPIQNYLAWFVISLVFLSFFKFFKTEYNNPVATRLLAVQMLFFVLLNIIHQTSGL